MKKQDKQALRELSLTKLYEKLREAQKELIQTKMKWASGKIEGQPPKLLADKVAVIKTIIKEKTQN